MKFTGLVSVDVMSRWNKAQQIYLYDILELNASPVELSIDQLQQNLVKHGVNLTSEELSVLYDSLKIEGEGSLNRVDRYANGHLL